MQILTYSGRLAVLLIATLATGCHHEAVTWVPTHEDMAKADRIVYEFLSGGYADTKFSNYFDAISWHFMVCETNNEILISSVPLEDYERRYSGTWKNNQKILLINYINAKAYPDSWELILLGGMGEGSPDYFGIRINMFSNEVITFVAEREPSASFSLTNREVIYAKPDNLTPRQDRRYERTKKWMRKLITEQQKLRKNKE